MSAVVVIGGAVAAISSGDSTGNVASTAPSPNTTPDSVVVPLPGATGPEPAASPTHAPSTPANDPSAGTPVTSGSNKPEGASGSDTAGTSKTGSTSAAEDRTAAGGAGTRSGANLAKHAGDLEINVDGTSISNMNIQGNLFVVANDVTVTNVKVDGYIAINRGRTGIAPLPVKRNMRFTNIDVRTIDNVGLDTVVVDRARFRGATDTTHFQATNYRRDGKFWKCDGLTLSNSVFDPPPPVTNSEVHMEALHPMGCSNLVIRNNVFDMTAPNPRTKAQTTAIMMLQTWNDRVNENVVFDGNELRGGGYYQLYLHAKNMSVTNNRFHSYREGAPVYPPSANPEPYTPFTQSGNTLDGKPITLTNNK
ncbi:hypothetical protein [Embleya hyalina]|uniref:hypothetical protein n=1 Tax=Embleya hyalina TaxID=516124 RepID=UPI0013570663|nr:hypothetical protein [Embleya hyalina]